MISIDSIISSGGGIQDGIAGRNPARQAPDRRVLGRADFPQRPLAFLWHYIRRRPGLHLCAVLSVMAAAGSAVASQYGIKLLVDAMSAGPGAIAGVWQALLFFGALLGAESLFWRSGGWFGAGAIIDDKAQMRLDLLHHLSGHSGRYFADQMAGGLANRINSTGDAAQTVLTTALWTVAPVCADFLGAMIIMAGIDRDLVMALAGFVVLMAGGLALVGLRGQVLHRDYADQAARVGGEMVDVAANIWMVKAFTARQRERARFAALIGAEAQAQRRSMRFVEGMRFAHDVSLWLMAAALMIWTVILWGRGQISAGDLVVVSALALRILHGSRDLAFALVNSTQHLARIADTISVIGQAHDVVDHPLATRLVDRGGAIRFEAVDFAYADGRPVLRDFNLAIPAGQKIGLVGPSGAGKSTLISLIQRQADVDHGRILLDQQPIHNLTQDSLRAAIAVVPQEIALFHRSVLDNIRYARPDADDDAIFAAARAARCDDFIRELPQGYQTLVGERGVKLSGGQRQRLGIARAILKNAPIIVLDEATSALDSDSEAEIQRALASLMQGRTVLAIAHRLATVARFDRIIVLDQGRIIEDGAPEALRRRSGGAFAALWALQAAE